MQEAAEFNCIGFSARLRDWARLGLLIARRGVSLAGHRVVSERWIDELTSWRAEEQSQLPTILPTILHLLTYLLTYLLTSVGQPVPICA